VGYFTIGLLEMYC